MPIYDYECPNCGIVKDVWAGIDEQEKLHGCMCWMKRLISAPSIRPDMEPHFDENLAPDGGNGSWVKSRQHRNELMGRYGLTNKWGEGNKQRWV